VKCVHDLKLMQKSKKLASLKQC